MSRSVNGHPPRWAWPLIAGGLVGIAAISRVQQLEAAVDLVAPIRAYDIWWPVLPAWVGMCFVWSVLADRQSTETVGQNTRRDGPRVGLLALGRRPQSTRAPLCRSDVSRAVERDALARASCPDGHDGMDYLQCQTTTAADWTLVARRCRLHCGDPWSRQQFDGGWTVKTLPLLLRPWFLWAAACTVLAVLWILSLIQRWKAGELHLPDVGKKGRWDDAVAVCAILAIVIGLADGLYFMQGTPVWDLVAALVGWAIFVEVVSVGPLADFVYRPLQNSLQSAKKIVVTDSEAIQRTCHDVVEIARRRHQGILHFQFGRRRGAAIRDSGGGARCDCRTPQRGQDGDRSIYRTGVVG